MTAPADHQPTYCSNDNARFTGRATPTSLVPLLNR